MWISFSDKTKTYNNPVDIIKEQISNHDLKKIFIGTDSEMYKFHSVYVTSLVFQRLGHGSVCFFKLNFDKYKTLKGFLKSTIKQRLYQEIQYTFYESYYIINWLREKDLEKHVPLELHFDINDDFLYQSAMFSKQASNIANGLNCNYKLKPDSIAASSIADKILKRKSYINNKIYNYSLVS